MSSRYSASALVGCYLVFSIGVVSTVRAACPAGSLPNDGCNPNGDGNGDCVLNLLDLPAFVDCLDSSGPGESPVLSACTDTFDAQENGVIDLADFNTMQLWWSGLLPDSDGDGVPDIIDFCPETPPGEMVEEDGCAASQRDSDNDGVTDDVDLCPDTPFGLPVGPDGCPAEVTGGGVAEPEPICGNGVIETGENCEPPNTSTCDADCHVIDPTSELSADNCADAAALDGEGTFVFDNTNATTDGPAHTACVSFGQDQIERDVWGRWTATCTGTVFVRTCGLTAVDTKLAVYLGTDCPVNDERLLNCNDDACSSGAVQSLVTFEAVRCQDYLIRLGTFPGEPGGVGGISILCGLPVCPSEGDCFAGHETPGCHDESCCERTCAVDTYCCESEWDDVCADEAQGLCMGSFSTCAERSGSCTDPNGNGTPGCSDVACCNAVCAHDPFCCIQEWDAVCATLEAAVCRTSCAAPGAGDCHLTHPSAGCDNDSCCAEVCVRDPVCCQDQWDATCVDLADEHCK